MLVLGFPHKPCEFAVRLGLFGGTFDPVHDGHLLLAECCREQCRLDAVWFLPAAQPPHKQGQTITPTHERIEMLELAIAGHPSFAICRHEIDRGGVSYTVDTLTHFHAEDPDRELFFLMGADMLLDLPHWRKPAKVCELATPVVVCRPTCGPLEFSCLDGIVAPKRIEAIRGHRVEMPEIGTSGSELRRRVSLGQSIRYRVPPAVELYIATHGLYADTQTATEPSHSYP